MPTYSENSSYYNRGIVKYTSRDYQSIMEDFWNLVPKMTELWKPEADADPGVVLGKFLASVADMLGINLDWLVNELFAPTVSQRKNAEKLFGLIGYKLKSYTAARTEVTFTNSTDGPIQLDFGFNGSNFSTLNAYVDITGASRVITYNVLPLTSKYGDTESRSRRAILTENINVFADTDKVTLGPGEAVTRVAVEGEFRSWSVSVSSIRKNNYTISLPSQHVDTTAVWVKAKASKDTEAFLATQWIQVASPADFVLPEPRFAVTYDNYSNAQLQFSTYLDQLETYDDNTYLTVYWFDCIGVLGCVGENVLTNFLQAKPYPVADEDTDLISISNLSNTVELPHTNTVTGQSPETAKQAYYNSRNYINTWDSLITLPDFTRFINREPGVDCGVCIDCQKALELNLAVYRDQNLSLSQKSKMYITNYDFPAGDSDVDWTPYINFDTVGTKSLHRLQPGETLQQVADFYGVDYEELLTYNYITDVTAVTTGYLLRIPVTSYNAPTFNFVSNFKTYTAMCFAIHNDFSPKSVWGPGQESFAKIHGTPLYTRYKPPQQFIDNVIRDYRPLQAMSVTLEFGYLRVFDFYIVGQLYTKQPVSKDVGANIIAKVKEDLALYFSSANRQIGQKPTVMEVVNVIRKSDSRIDYFDAGSLKNPVITYFNCDIEYFNAISFARYSDPGESATNIRISPECLVN